MGGKRRLILISTHLIEQFLAQGAEAVDMVQPLVKPRIRFVRMRDEQTMELEVESESFDELPHGTPRDRCYHAVTLRRREVVAEGAPPT